MEETNKQRHSLAHIMANAVQHHWPDAKFGVGPVIENGFYYDIDLGDKTISEEDLPKIEKEMKKVIKEAQTFEQFDKPIDEAILWAKDNMQPYKEELLNDLKRAGTTAAKDLDTTELGLPSDVSKVDTVSFYRNGDFTDLCRGPHVSNTREVGAFKLTRVAGAYWRGKETNPQMQRIYGVAFANHEELDHYFKMLEEAKARDHRKLGQELDLFMFSDLVGAGLPLMMPKGEIVKHTLMEYMRTKEEALGYQYVSTPVLTHEELYIRSGHAKFYAEDMYQLVDDEGNKFYLKPMNCPHHHMIYERMVKSYRDLPLMLAESSGLYRKELSGTLTGLIRVRGPITQNDSHIYVTPEQLKAEFLKVVALFDEVYEEVGIKDYWFRLSLPDFTSDKFSGDKKRWEEAGKAISEALNESGADFVEAEGEAAFYGPKLDIQVRNVMGKEDSIATVQVDILVPERMNLVYVDNEGKEQRPLIIHRAILGSFERFIAFLLEQTAGKFTVWLAPEQLRITALNDDEQVINAAKELVERAKALGLRVGLDITNESVGKKIRAAEVMKVPYTIVIGGKEVESGKVTPRVRSDLPKLEQETMVAAEFLAKLSEDVKNRK
jgi:threonyl-tRNA synthetase